LALPFTPKQAVYPICGPIIPLFAPCGIAQLVSQHQNQKTMYSVLLPLHIIAGFVALTSGVFAMLSVKGTSNHNLSGRIYAYSMYAVALTAVLIALFIRFNPFLLSIGVFAAYLTYGGHQCIRFWRMKTAYEPGLKDKIYLYLSLPTGIFMLIYPFYQMYTLNQFFVPVLSVFGFFMIAGTVQDLRVYNRPENFLPKNRFWLLNHISRMGGAYIATFTAFAVTNIQISQWWIVWLTPSLVGTILITKQVRKWKEKLRIS
jgi:uncharacterized membrane protein